MSVGASTAVVVPATPSAVTHSAAAAPSPVASSSATAAGGSASSSGASAAAATGLKKCALCQHPRPECNYSGAQLKAKAKRQCKICVAALQARASPSKPVAVPTDVSARLAKCSSLLNDPSESQHLSGLQKLTDLLAEMLSVDISPHLDGALVTHVVDLVRHARSLGLHSAAVGCVVQMCHHPPLVAALVGAGSIPLLLQGLRYNKTEAPRIGFTRVLSLIASAPDSSGHCDALLAAGALPVLLELLEPITAPEVCEGSSRLLRQLLSGRPPAEIIAAVTHFGTIIMNRSSTTPPLVCCLRELDRAIYQSKPQHKSQWVDAVLGAAPGLPQRLVDLLADGRAEVRTAAARLLDRLFHVRSAHPQLRVLIECGLIGRLLPLLDDHFDDQTTAVAALCTHIADCCIEFARLLLDDGPLIQRLLELMSMAFGALFFSSVGILTCPLQYRDPDLTHRLVHDHGALPPLVAALRKSCAHDAQDSSLTALLAVVEVLEAGDAEAEADAQRWCGVNPYNEPLFDLGVFEIAESLCDSKNAELAQAAKAVFAYCTPDDVD